MISRDTRAFNLNCVGYAPFCRLDDDERKAAIARAVAKMKGVPAERLEAEAVKAERRVA